MITQNDIKCFSITYFDLTSLTTFEASSSKIRKMYNKVTNPSSDFVNVNNFNNPILVPNDASNIVLSSSDTFLTLSQTSLVYNESLWPENNLDNQLVIEERWLRYSPAVSTVFFLAYTLIFILGIIGNCFVVAVVVRSPRMRTVTNYFIVNLALADILVLIFCLPATLLGNLLIRKSYFYNKQLIL